MWLFMVVSLAIAKRFYDLVSILWMISSNDGIEGQPMDIPTCRVACRNCTRATLDDTAERGGMGDGRLGCGRDSDQRTQRRARHHADRTWPSREGLQTDRRRDREQ